ncbi:DNA N-6-adenine-methyltransferase [Streptococcus agalactiae]|nr:adenine methyltransferase [Streptococcus agalactiae]HEN6426239.1 adenine methyltransferase [Streptococcus agalactiae]HEN6661752.1 adenine methyltransferase [Streptococcus agalactiae]HEN7501326.1 adenine methyltransferase [Streptococcus agalactiae]HEN7654494.1 adenine methyltransferase [Streptococcus agalactiae]
MMVVQKSLLSSDKDYWETPQNFFEKLNEEFNFNLDVASSDNNAKCKNHFTVDDDGLSQDWTGNVFCNPPYGREIGKWVEKAYKESLEPYNNVIVLLIPARTDTKYWHDYIFGKATDIRFLKGRLKFTINGKENHPAPFPSAVIIY